MTGVALLIPAYQPDPGLPALVKAILEDPLGTVDFATVVNDGSTAEHEPIFRELASMKNVDVVPHAVNLGKGAALKTGFNWILARHPEITGILTVDADGQHLPHDAGRVAREHAARPSALILGSRTFHGPIPFRSRFGNSLTRFVFRIFTGLALRDTQTGLRVWPRTQCLGALRLPYNGYEFEFEALVKASSAQIHEVPIETVYQAGNKSSHFNPVRDSLRIYYVFLRYSASAILAAVIDSSVFSLTLWKTGNLVASQVAGRALATMVAFFVLRHLVFRSTGGAWKTLMRFVTLVIISGAVSLRLIEAMVDAGFTPLSAKLLAEGTLFAANFAVQRTLIFLRE